ncbi:uncharacterized protein Bfra_005667 [Botrytis fragariae]|uniref:Uncharacterized protein n=1 Tax=Botrytis fragariae TaxID=1964551 RepID=A0A8H6EHQ7_9HELO|nr:uncharacterized protein Bfra_005667 [Botrytis fragariae]KAF5872310.1 hypothetical protein Bfra_005667 [Botrytis fragariae]
MHIARKASYTPHENESGRLWLKFGGRTINFIMINKKKDKNDADPGSEPLRGTISKAPYQIASWKGSNDCEGLFKRGLWVGFGMKKFKSEKVESKEDTNKMSEMDDKGLDMK